MVPKKKLNCIKTKGARKVNKLNKSEKKKTDYHHSREKKERKRIKLICGK